jgi:hypothetical protein
VWPEGGRDSRNGPIRSLVIRHRECATGFDSKLFNGIRRMVCRLPPFTRYVELPPNGIILPMISVKRPIAETTCGLAAI